MKKFHFSCGNSTTGVVGFCAEVSADTREQAVSKLRNALESSLGPLGAVQINLEESFIGYMNVYINPTYIGASQIEE